MAVLLLLAVIGSVEILVFQSGGDLAATDGPISPPLRSSVCCCQVGMQLVG